MINPTTKNVKLFDLLRKLFSQCSLSRVRGYGPGRFSFNLPGGRCERCKGDGVVKLDMQFLADVFVECEIDNVRALAVKYPVLSHCIQSD